MKKIVLSLFACLQMCQLSAQTNYSPETLERIKEIENNVTGPFILNDRPNTIAERMAGYKVKGMSIAVIQDYKIVWAKGYGWADEAEKRPVTTQTLFEPGSISKSLNAVGILKLAQDKKVDLYTDVNTYLTSWKFPYDSLSKGKKITLAQILSHTAGLSTYGFPGQSAKGEVPTVLQVLDGKPPAVTPAVRSMFEPGLKFEYSGGGITISQLLLTDVTGKTYDTWMYDNVLKPIGMPHSFYGPPAKDKKYLCASGYYNDGTPVANKYRIYPEQAAAGLWTTPSELCNYVIDMQLAYKGNASKVLTPDMVKLHLTPNNTDMTAMGTFIEDHDGTRYFKHDASNDGFCGLYYGSLEEGCGVVIFANTGDGRILYDVANSVAKAYNWKNFYREPTKLVTGKVVDVADSVLKNYEGIYLYDKTWAAIGKRNNEHHFYTNGMYVKMYYTTPVSFFNEEFTAIKKMVKDAHGNVTGYARTVDGKEYPQAIKVTNPDTLTLEQDIFSGICSYLIETRQYKEALDYYRRSLQLYPGDLNTTINMAHAYLLSNDYKNALAIYKTHINDTLSAGNSWQSQMRLDLMYFADHYYDVRLFDKVFAELKIKKPKGY